MGFKITTVLNKNIVVFALMLFLAPNTFAQIGTPTYTFTQMCARPDDPDTPGNDGFNSFSVSFTFNPASFSAGNTFTLQMSNEAGSFSSPTILAGPTVMATSPGNFNFAIPLTSAGQGYKLRVVSSAPASNGSSTVGIAAYYQSFYKNFYINNQAATISICGGGSFTLSIDNPTPSVIGSSPATYPNLKYKWYRGTTLIPGEIGTSININTGGNYHVEIDYGTCTTQSSITRSQDVAVTISPDAQVFQLVASGTQICDNPITLSTQQGYSYQWFRDNVLISNATSYSYVTSQAGTYHVVVDQGGCSAATNTVVLTAETFNASINVMPSSFLTPGETKTINVTTDAAGPEYQWYSGTPLLPISGEINSSFTATVAGNYKVDVYQTIGCLATKEIFFTLKEGTAAVKIPNMISPNADETNDTWTIPDEFIGPDTEVMIMNSVGEIVLQTKNYQNNWPQSPIEFKSVNPVFYYIITKEGAGTKKGSITVIK